METRGCAERAGTAREKIGKSKEHGSVVEPCLIPSVRSWGVTQ